MDALTFGSFDFTQDGVWVQEHEVDLQQVQLPTFAVPAAEGVFDLLGARRQPRGAGTIALRMLLGRTAVRTVDAQLDALNAELMKGTQWLRVAHDDGSVRRISAKCTGVSAPRSRRDHVALPVAVTFTATEPFWYGDVQETLTVPVVASPTSFTFVPGGTAPLRKLILRFTGIATDPTFTNSTNGFSLQKTGTLNGVTWQISTGNWSVLVAGADDYANLVLPATQVELFRCEPEGNQLAFTGTGTVSGSIDLIYRPTYF